MNISSLTSIQSAQIDVTGTYAYWLEQPEVKTTNKPSEEDTSFCARPQNEKSLHEKMLACINIKTLDAYETLFDTLRNQCSEEEKQDLRCSVSFFKTVAQHYIANACDSVFTRLINAQPIEQYNLNITLRLELTKSHLRLEVEDNGLGIDPAVINRLFKEDVSSKKDPTLLPNIGGVGIGLLNVQLYANNLNGKASCINKGQNMGATFSFEAPINECRLLSESEAYKRKCMRDDMYASCYQS